MPCPMRLAGFEYDDFFAIADNAFISVVESGVKVIGFAFEFGGAGIDHFIDPADAEFFAVFGDFDLRNAPGPAQAI